MSRLAAIVALVVTMCLAGAAACRKIERPEGVPASAVALGTSKRFEFVDCAPAGAPRQYDCAVYRGSRDPVARGYFDLVGGEAFDPRAAAEYGGFNGTDIELTAGRKLRLREPSRPRGVPPSAVWGGGPQAGAFFDCAAGAEGSYACSIFEERTGALLARGAYALHGDAPSGRKSMSGGNAATGGRIFVEPGGAYLDPVD
jgi:hypothetical protein